MALVESSIRTEVKRGEFPSPKGAEIFPAYAIAHGKGLIPEMESAARQTLEHPMTFEILGEGLQSFEGWALRDLVNFRRRCRDNLITCLDSFLEKFPRDWGYHSQRSLNKFLTQIKNDLKLKIFTRPLNIPSRIRQEYLRAFEDGVCCNGCAGAFEKEGSIFCAGLETELVQARDKVTYFPYLSKCHEIHFS
jgi:hypothetical protein